MKIFVCVLCVVAVVSCTPVGSNDDPTSHIFDEVKSCVDGEDAVSCLKEQALETVQRLEGARTLKLFNGVTLLNNGPRKSRSLEPLSADADVRKRQVSERLWKSTSDLMESGDIELAFGGEEDDMSESRAINEVDEGRGKKKKLKKKLKILIPLMILAKAKAVALVVLALLVIAASLFKLALLAKVAFIIKIIAIIKALIAAKKHHQEETWEIAAPSHGWEPHSEHVSHVEHGHGWESQGWSRSRKEGNNLAYSAYAN